MKDGEGEDEKYGYEDEHGRFMKNNERKKKNWPREMENENKEKKKEVEEKDEGRSWRIKKEKVERKENGKERGDKILLVSLSLFLISLFFFFVPNSYHYLFFSPLHLLHLFPLFYS